MSPTPSSTSCTLAIGGMTCRSCEVLLERKLKAVPGVASVHADHRSGTVQITAKPGAVLDRSRMEHVIREAGYDPADAVVTHPLDAWGEAAAAMLLILAVWFILRQFRIADLAPSTSGAVSVTGAFIIGLVAGGSSCLAVTGGLLLAIAAKHAERHPSERGWKSFRPMLQFNLGRLLSYVILGGVVGWLGSGLVLGPKTTGILNVTVALFMAYVAMSLLHLLPAQAFRIPLFKRMAHGIHDLAERDHPAMPMLLGAMTFFLPCGFTQSLQLVALATASPVEGALLMGAFALGTLPALLGISVFSAWADGRIAAGFLRFAGATVLLLAVFNLQSGLTLMGIDVSRIVALGPRTGTATAPAAPMAEGVQEIAMRVTPYGYQPNTFTIRAGIPVRWTVDGSGSSGCTSVLVIPDLGITRPLVQGPNVIEFTAPRPGTLAFSCSMGMVGGRFNVL